MWRTKILWRQYVSSIVNWSFKGQESHGLNILKLTNYCDFAVILVLGDSYDRGLTEKTVTKAEAPIQLDSLNELWSIISQDYKGLHYRLPLAKLIYVNGTSASDASNAFMTLASLNQRGQAKCS